MSAFQGGDISTPHTMFRQQTNGNLVTQVSEGDGSQIRLNSRPANPVDQTANDLGLSASN